MQKTFNVWVKKRNTEFVVCSKKVTAAVMTMESVDVARNDVYGGSIVQSCDVSQWLETLGLDENEVIEGQITFKFKNK